MKKVASTPAMHTLAEPAVASFSGGVSPFACGRRSSFTGQTASSSHSGVRSSSWTTLKQRPSAACKAFPLYADLQPASVIPHQSAEGTAVVSSTRVSRPSFCKFSDAAVEAAPPLVFAEVESDGAKAEAFTSRLVHGGKAAGHLASSNQISNITGRYNDWVRRIRRRQRREHTNTVLSTITAQPVQTTEPGRALLPSLSQQLRDVFHIEHI